MPAGLSVSRGADVRLCVRPEALSLAPRAPSQMSAVASPDGTTLPGTVARKAFLGDLMRYWIKIDDREWIVDQPDPGASQPYDGDVSVSIRPERVHLIAESA